jgi:penicillin-binding protein 1C
MSRLKRIGLHLVRKWKWTAPLLVLCIWYILCLPKELFHEPYSTVLFARNGELLSASIAADGQWRFPLSTSVNEKYRKAVVAYEDKRFYSHPGIDVISLGRAIQQNMDAGKVVSGGSTITMQVVRLSRKGKKRTILEKVREIILATRLEMRYSKEAILNLYASHAPFGGNVVGMEAACWRYFGRGDKELSWGEAALLAVLPNSPALIHPGRNRETLRRKRDDLLDRLLRAGTIDSLTCLLARQEALPGEPVPLPRHARHLLDRLSRDGHHEEAIRSTINYGLQQIVEETLERNHVRLKGNQIHNAAAIVADVETGEVLAYIGNVGSRKQDAVHVDIIHARRSTGSILKPFLYAAMLDEGKILPTTLLPDIPTFINGFAPKNFSHDYDGAVPAHMALIRSLNIPAVNMLREYRYERFHRLLQQMGMRTLDKPADHYGLSLILGGAEGSLWDVTGIYASMARTLNHYATFPGSNRYMRRDFHALSYTSARTTASPETEPTSWLSAASIYHTFDALKELYRPGEESGWRYFTNQKNIAWKTGTSFGFRDGWAIGVTPQYVVGVWVGNADGEGRPGLTGSDAAAPVMFEIFSHLRSEQWFVPPRHEMKELSICRKSGLRSTAICPDTEIVRVTERALQTLPCHYHKTIHLSSDGEFQVNNLCASPTDTRRSSWFVLPPSQEYYFRKKNVSYQSLPPFRPGCTHDERSVMDFIYPKGGSKFFIPRDLAGKENEVIFKLAHRNNAATVYWHIDGTYVASTKTNHSLPLRPSQGRHRLMVIDDNGAVLEQEFEVLPRL